MEKITVAQALNKTVVATKNYIDKTVTVVDTDLQQVIYDIYGSISEESPIEGFISYDESTKTINIKGSTEGWNSNWSFGYTGTINYLNS